MGVAGSNSSMTQFDELAVVQWQQKSARSGGEETDAMIVPYERSKLVSNTRIRPFREDERPTFAPIKPVQKSPFVKNGRQQPAEQVVRVGNGAAQKGPRSDPTPSAQRHSAILLGRTGKGDLPNGKLTKVVKAEISPYVQDKVSDDAMDRRQGSKGSTGSGTGPPLRPKTVRGLVQGRTSILV